MRLCRAGLLLALSFVLVSSSFIMNTRNSSADSRLNSTIGNETKKPKIAFAIHGGAGVISRSTLTPEREREWKRR